MRYFSRSASCWSAMRIYGRCLLNKYTTGAPLDELCLAFVWTGLAVDDIMILASHWLVSRRLHVFQNRRTMCVYLLCSHIDGFILLCFFCSVFSHLSTGPAPRQKLREFLLKVLHLTDGQSMAWNPVTSQESHLKTTHHVSRR